MENSIEKYLVTDVVVLQMPLLLAALVSGNNAKKDVMKLLPLQDLVAAK